MKTHIVIGVVFLFLIQGCNSKSEQYEVITDDRILIKFDKVTGQTWYSMPMYEKWVKIPNSKSVISYRNNKPEKQVSYLGIKLGDSEKDVLFVHNRPTDSKENDWIYVEKLYVGFGVNFHKGKVRFVVSNKISPDGDYALQGISINDVTDRVLEKFGNNYDAEIAEQGFSRIYSYPKYNVFFVFELNKVYKMGIYDPQHGNIKFVDEGGFINPSSTYQLSPTIQKRTSATGLKQLEHIFDTKRRRLDKKK